MKNNNLKWYKIEEILKFVKYDNKCDDFYAYIPDNHVIISGKNKGYTINKLRLYQKSRETTISIGDVNFYCELLTRNIDNNVLLSIEYKDDEEDEQIQDIQKNRLFKYIESMLLGFDSYGKQYEDNPAEFFKQKQRHEVKISNDAW
tara:strand:+ start:145 stop:582 length:438 start_codon:yes stop_codon:yes gene_type:complete